MTKNISKKNIIIAAALVAIMAIGSTFAFFIDRDSVTNQFTVGDVEISVDEPNWNPDDGQNITPNKEMKKDPQVTNKGANDAFVFVSVTVPKADVKTANDKGELQPSQNQDLFTYTVNEGWKLIKTSNNSDSTEYVYAFATEAGEMYALQPGTTTVPVFDKVKFINVVEEQLDGSELNIDVNTMGIQTVDLGTSNPIEIYNIIMNQQEQEN